MAHRHQGHEVEVVDDFPVTATYDTAEAGDFIESADALLAAEAGGSRT